MVGDTERRLFRSLAAVAALLLAATGYSVISLDRALDDLRQIARAHEVIARLRSSHLAVAEIETGMRGLLLTGDKAYLVPSAKTRDAARRHLEHVRVLVSDDLAQQRRLDHLLALVEARFKDIDALALARVAGPLAEAQVGTSLDASESEMDAIHEAIGVMLQVEEQEIVSRAQRIETAAPAKSVALGAVAGIVLLLLAGGFLLVRRDLEVRRATEAELRRAKEAAEAANRELEAFSSSVSHDLRTPLQAIGGYAELLLEHEAKQIEERGRGYLRTITDQAHRMGSLIDDLLRLSQVARAELRRERVDLSGLAREVLDDLRRSDPERAVEVVIQEGAVIDGDSALLRVVLVNLFGNAWKFTKRTERARIEFEMSAGPDGRRAFVVRDNGAGFDMQEAPRLFSAFQRLHEQSEFAGTGIGLATVRRVVERHGGRVWAEGTVGHGASIFFTLA